MRDIFEIEGRIGTQIPRVTITYQDLRVILDILHDYRVCMLYKLNQLIPFRENWTENDWSPGRNFKQFTGAHIFWMVKAIEKELKSPCEVLKFESSRSDTMASGNN